MIPRTAFRGALFAAIVAARCAAFAPRGSWIAGSMVVERTSPHRHVLSAEEEAAGVGGEDSEGGSLLASFPSPEVLKQNLVEVSCE